MEYEFHEPFRHSPQVWISLVSCLVIWEENVHGKTEYLCVHLGMTYQENRKCLIFRGRLYERQLRRSRNKPEQLVVLKYPNFRPKICASVFIKLTQGLLSNLEQLLYGLSHQTVKKEKGAHFICVQRWRTEFHNRFPNIKN